MQKIVVIQIKGVILAGGTGSRMYPATEVTNKHLLPVHDKPMIFYPIETLVNAGIKEIMITTNGQVAGDLIKLLGSGKRFGANISFRIQDEAGGIAQALGLAENFAGGDSIALILGDNIFENVPNVSEFNEGAKVFLKEVPDPHRFGIAEIENGKISNIVEKPREPKTNYAVVGFYLYDNTVFDKIKLQKPSARGELEITDVNNEYIKDGKLGYQIINGFWSDAGSFESIHRATSLVRDKLNTEKS